MVRDILPVDIHPSCPMPFVTAAGHTLEYQRIEADPSRPTLVFLHEGLGSITQWRDFPRKVVEATRCPALVYARYGYGQSDPRRSQRRGFDRADPCRCGKPGARRGGRGAA